MLDQLKEIFLPRPSFTPDDRKSEEIDRLRRMLENAERRVNELERKAAALDELERMLKESAVRLVERDWAGQPLYFVNTGEKTGLAGGWDTEHEADSLADAILAAAAASESGKGGAEG